MFGLKGTLIAGALGAVGMLVLALMWQMEKSAHKDTLRILDGETRRANVATEAAAQNAEKVAEIKQLMFQAQERQKARDAENSRILADKNAQIADMLRMKEKFHEYTSKKPAVAARAWRFDFNRMQRRLSEATCRTDCEDGSTESPD